MTPAAAFSTSCDGREDLEAGIIRTIGDPERRFREDKLRLLRAVRFAARFGYRIEPRTFAAMRALAGEVRAGQPRAPARRADPMLTEGHARRAFELLDESGLLHACAAGAAAHEGRRAASAVPSRGRRLGAHLAAAGNAARRLLAHAGLGRPAARRRQAADLPRGAGPHPLRRPRRDRRPHGRGDLPRACASATTTPSRSPRSSPSTCALPTRRA